MIVGYAAFEAVLYGSLSTALAGVPSNAVQGIGGTIFAVTLFETLIKRSPIVKGMAPVAENAE